MAVDLSNTPVDRIMKLARHLGMRPNPKRPAKQFRDEVSAGLHDKETRMTPWGLQFCRPRSTYWVPEMSFPGQTMMCGQWIRDIDIPEDFHGNHPRCSVCGQKFSKLVSSDLKGASSEVLSAFRYGEVTDPTLDLAEDFAPTEIRLPETERCMIAELPAELLELILSYLIPAGGQTYHFYPARSGTHTVQLIQKLVLEPRATDPPFVNDNAAPSNTCSHTFQAISNRLSSNPATGSVYGLSLAASCSYFQDIVYSRFFGNNAFIFHLTAATIHNNITVNDFGTCRAWSRTTPEVKGALGPLTARAASYLKHVTLVASIPLSYGRKDVAALSEVISEAATSLAAAQLDHLSLCLNVAETVYDQRYKLVALKVDRLQGEVDHGELTVRVRDPGVEFVKESGKVQKALLPLLQGPKDVKELVLSGPISESLVRELENTLIRPKSSRGTEVETSTSVEATDTRSSKRQRIM